MINSRPLSYITADDFDEPLTPSHLMTGRPILSPDHLCHSSEDDIDTGCSLLNKRACHVNRTIDSFWKRWTREYLLELREAHRHHCGRSGTSPIAVNDVVIVCSKDQPRGFWKIGRVKKVLVGRDGQIRGATVRVASKGRQASTLNRPIQLLYTLEAREESEGEEQPPPSDGTDSVKPTADSEGRDNMNPSEQQQNMADSCVSMRCSKCVAAHEAQDRLLAQALCED